MYIILISFLISISIDAKEFQLNGSSPLFSPRILSKVLAMQDALNQIIERNDLYVQTRTELKNGLIDRYHINIQSNMSLRILNYSCEEKLEMMSCQIYAIKSFSKQKKYKSNFENISACNKNNNHILCYTYHQISNLGNLRKIKFSIIDQFKRVLFSDEITTFSDEKNGIHQQINKNLNTQGLINKLKTRTKLIKMTNILNGKEKNYITLQGLEVFDHNGRTYIEIPSFIPKNIDEYSDK